MPKGYGVQSTTKKKKQFLAVFAEFGNVTHASKEAGIDRKCHYLWLEKDEDYAEKFASAREEAADLLEAEVRRRGVEGVKEPVFYQGEVCGHVRKYSDVLLIFLLKGVRPHKFRDKMEISDPSGRNPLTAALEDMWTKLESGRGGNGGDAVKMLEAHVDPGNGVPVNAVIELERVETKPTSKTPELKMGESPSLRPCFMISDKDEDNDE